VKVDLKAFGELADTLFFMKQPEDAKLVSAAMRELEAHRARDVASGDLLAEFWRLDAERVRTIEAYNAELRHQRDRGIIAPKVDPEYQAMEAARLAWWDAIKKMQAAAPAAHVPETA
jgi:hypothetical protein